MSPAAMASADQTNISFAGCGFMCVYHVGVATCLQVRCYLPAHVSRVTYQRMCHVLLTSARVTCYLLL